MFRGSKRILKEESKVGNCAREDAGFCTNSCGSCKLERVTPKPEPEPAPKPEPKTEQPKTEQPKTEQPKTEQPKTPKK